MLDEAKLGPKMRALTPMRRAFVDALLMQGDRNYTQAARMAGFSDRSYGSLKVEAHRMWHDEKVQEALHEESQRRLKGMLPLAVKVIGDVAENPQASGAERLKAAGMILDRAGLHAVSETVHRHDQITDDREVLKRIETLARALKVPVEQLLGDRLAKLEPPTIEAEYEEMTTAGIEGLI